MLAENIDPRAAQVSSASPSTDFLPIVPSTNEAITETRPRDKGCLLSSGANRMAPLYGKKIFMHYDQGTSVDKYLESVLRKLKAELVDFFSRDVHYIVSNRPQSRIPSLSPNPTDNSSTKPSLPARSSNGPAGLKTPSMPTMKSASAAVNRGRAMLMAARRSAGTTNNISPQDSKPSTVLRQIQPTNSGSTTVPSKPPGGGSTGQALKDTSPSGVGSPSNDLLVRARRLGIRILTVESVFKWIRNLPSDVQAYIQSIERADSEESITDIPEDPERDRACQVRHLTTPCIKILDVTGQTRPLYMDHTDYLPGLWNLLSRRPSKTKDNMGESSTAAVGSGSVPAASLGRTGTHSHAVTGATGTQSILGRQNSRTKRKERLNKHHAGVKLAHSLKRSASIPGKMNGIADTRSKLAVEDEPSGYCECCSMTFSNLFEHLKCPEHQQFATNTENYHLLDDVLNRLPSLQSFLASEATKQRTAAPTQRRPGAHKKRHRSGSKSSSGETQKAPEPQKELEKQELPAGELPPEVAVLEKSPVEPMVPPCLKLFNPSERNQPEPAEQLKFFSEDEEDGEELVNSVTKDVIIPISPPPDTLTLATTEGNNLASEEHLPTEAQLVPFRSPVVDLDEEQGPSPTEPVDQQPPSVATIAAWHSICSEVYVSEQFRKPIPPSDTDFTLEASPILERFHLPCTACCRSHIPSKLSDVTHLKLNSLFGPGCRLDGLGCETNSPCNILSPIATHSSQEQESTPEETPVLSTPQGDHNIALPPFSPTHSGSHSPVFDSKDIERTHHTDDCTLPTSPMRRVSFDQPDRLGSSPPDNNHQSASDPVVSTPPSLSRPIISTPRVSPHSESSTPPTSCCVVPSGSPSARSDTGSNRKRLNWLLNSASFDVKLPCESPSSPRSEVLRSRQKTNKRRRRRVESSGAESAVLRQLPVLKRTKLSMEKSVIPGSKSQTKPASSGLNQTRLSQRERRRKRTRKVGETPPPYATPIRVVIPRIAARVARESISLSVRALYSPSALDRFSDEHRQPPILPVSLSPVKSVTITSLCQRRSRVSICSPTSNDVEKVPHRRKKWKRILFPPDSPVQTPDASEDEFFDNPVPRSRGSGRSFLSSPKLNVLNRSSDGGR